MNLKKENESLYIKYHRLPPFAWQRKIAFYLQHREAIFLVDRSERREIEIDYLIALFEVGKYKRFLDNVDPLIEAVIVENIYKHNGKDIYPNLLFKKAACYYNLNRFQESIQISNQLIEIDKKDKSFKHLLFRAQFKLNRKWYDIIIAATVFILFLAVSTFLLEIFVVEPFYAMYLDWTIKIRYALFGTATLLFITNEFIRRVKITGI